MLWPVARLDTEAFITAHFKQIKQRSRTQEAISLHAWPASELGHVVEERESFGELVGNDSIHHARRSMILRASNLEVIRDTGAAATARFLRRIDASGRSRILPLRRFGGSPLLQQGGSNASALRQDVMSIKMGLSPGCHPVPLRRHPAGSHRAQRKCPMLQRCAKSIGHAP
jgi:hypothetical protein